MKKIFPFFRPHLAKVGGAVLCMTAASLATSGYAWLTGPAARVALFPDGGGEAGGAGAGAAALDGAARLLGWGPVAVIAAAVALLALVRAGAGFLQGLLMAKAGQGVQAGVRAAAWRRIAAAPAPAVQGMGRGDLAAKVTADVAVLEAAFSHAIATGVGDGLQAAFLVVLAFLLDPPLAAAAALVIPAALLVVVLLGRRTRRAYRGALETRGKIAGRFVELARGLPVLKVFLAAKSEEERFLLLDRAYAAAQVRAACLAGAASPIVELLGAAAVASIFAWIALRSPSGAQDPARLVSFFATLILLYRPARALGSVAALVQQGLAAAARLEPLLALEAEPPGGARPTPPLEKGVRLEDVRCAYDGGEVLSGCTLDIPAGKVTALVGASGAGKTTIVSLLCAFVAPRGGRVLWDGADYRELSTETLRGRIALAAQDPFLVSGTVGENLLLGKSAAAGEAAAAEAAAAAGVAQGAGDRVEEEGARLSAGERQRVCVARAMLARGDLVILDEAASSLESESEAAIHAALRARNPRAAILVVSHRWSTVGSADRIALLDGGRIVEEGTPGELRRPGTRTHALFASQL